MQLMITCSVCGEEALVTRRDGKAECPECGRELAVPAVGLAPGVVLGGDFRLERSLGRASLGSTWLATQLSMERSVRLLILSEAGRCDPEALARFLRELRLTANLDHPNVLRALVAGEDDGVLFLATEYASGETLKNILDKRGRLPEREALAILGQIADALDYAWRERKVLHRNLKPRTVLVNAEGKAFLIDLGIAKSLAEESAHLTGTGVAIGSPQYMSPEQCQGREPLDCHSDMYAFGCLLYHCLTGRPPFDDDNVVSLMQRHLREPHPPLGLHAKVSDAVVELVDKLLAKDAGDRPKRWEDVRAACEAAVRPEAGGPRRKPEPKRPEAATKAMTAPPTLGAVTARQPSVWPRVLVVLAIAGVVGYAVFRSQTSRPDQRHGAADRANADHGNVAGVPDPEAQGRDPADSGANIPDSGSHVVGSKQEAIAEAWRRAEDYRAERPDDIETLVRMYTLIERQSGGTKYKAMAANVLGTLTEVSNATWAAARKAKRAKFMNLLKAELFEEADIMVDEFPETEQTELLKLIEQHQVLAAEHRAQAEEAKLAEEPKVKLPPFARFKHTVSVEVRGPVSANRAQGSLTCSGDLRHWSCVEQVGRRWQVVIDGSKREGPYSELFTPCPDQVSQPHVSWSRDGALYAYHAVGAQGKYQGKHMVVVQGKPGPPLSEVSRVLAVGPSGKRVLYGGRWGYPYECGAFLNHREVKSRKGKYAPQCFAFSGNGKFAAWAQQDGNERRFSVYVNGNGELRGEAYIRELGLLDDGAPVAIGNDDAGDYVWQGANQTPPYASCSNLHTAGTHWACIANKGQVWVVLYDGKEVATVDERIEEVALSADGKHVAFVGKKGDTYRLYRDAKPVTEFESHHGNMVSISPDGSKVFAFDMGRQTGYQFRMNDQSIPVDYRTVSGVFSPFTWSPDGRFVVITAESTRDHVFVNGVCIGDWEDVEVRMRPRFDDTGFRFGAVRDGKYVVVHVTLER